MSLLTLLPLKLENNLLEAMGRFFQRETFLLFSAFNISFMPVVSLAAPLSVLL